jgi:hypothetical protein
MHRGDGVISRGRAWTFEQPRLVLEQHPALAWRITVCALEYELHLCAEVRIQAHVVRLLVRALMRLKVSRHARGEGHCTYQAEYLERFFFYMCAIVAVSRVLEVLQRQ